MVQLKLTADQAGYIAARMDRFAEEAEPSTRWLVPAVHQAAALPLFWDGTVVAGIRQDGTVVVWGVEEGATAAREVDHVLFVRRVLVYGANRHPALRGLIPAR